MSNKVQPGDIFRFVGGYRNTGEEYYMIIGPRRGEPEGWDMILFGDPKATPWDSEKNLTDPHFYVRVA